MTLLWDACHLGRVLNFVAGVGDAPCRGAPWILFTTPLGLLPLWFIFAPPPADGMCTFPRADAVGLPHPPLHVYGDGGKGFLGTVTFISSFHTGTSGSGPRLCCIPPSYLFCISGGCTACLEWDHRLASTGWMSFLLGTRGIFMGFSGFPLPPMRSVSPFPLGWAHAHCFLFCAHGGLGVRFYVGPLTHAVLLPPTASATQALRLPLDYWCCIPIPS